jgi:hypothetical protein
MSGVTMACFNESGTRPDANKAFPILVIGTANTLKNFFNKGVGSGSRQHDFAGEARITSVTDFTDTGTKRSK